MKKLLEQTSDWDSLQIATWLEESLQNLNIYMFSDAMCWEGGCEGRLDDFISITKDWNTD